MKSALQKKVRGCSIHLTIT